MKRPIPLAQLSSTVLEEPQTLEIPRHLPQTVRDVAESLLLRDQESARRYLEAHLEQKKRD